MTASKAYLAKRAVTLRRQKLSYGLIAMRLGTSVPFVCQCVNKHAPELRGAITAQHTRGFG